jgi:arginase
MNLKQDGIIPPSISGSKKAEGSIIKDRSSSAVPQSAHKSVSLVGACVNEGQDWYVGVETAPQAFRDAGIVKLIESMGYSVSDLGDVGVDRSVGPERSVSDEYYKTGTIKQVEVLGETCGRLHEIVRRESALVDNFVLTLGGDHAIAAATISGIKKARNDIAVVWIDAHADCNIPETSPSGNFHGMPVGLLLGWFKKRAHPRFDWIQEYLEDPLAEHRMAYIGLRDVDEGEKALLRNSNIHVYSMIDVERLGIARVMEQIIEAIAPNGCRPIHLSFDIDGVDPSIAPGTGTRARGGLNFRECRYICTRLAGTGALKSMDLVEINPTIDIHEISSKTEHGDNPHVKASASMTVKLGMDLIQFALGHTLT